MRQLEAFDAVVVNGGATAAAQVLNLSQPSVSRLIADLEAAVGFPLFQREGRGMVVTPEGQHFWEETSRSFDGLGRLTRFADDIRMLRMGSLRIAVAPALSFGALPRAVARLRRDSPDLTILCEQRSSEHVMKAVADLNLDVALAVDGPTVEGVANRAVYRTRCVCVMPQDHPLTKKSVIGAADLQGVKRVALPHYTSVSLQLNKLLADERIEPRTHLEALMSSMACAMVAEGLGVCILDPFSAKAFAGLGIVSRPFRPDITFGVRIVHSDRRTLSRVAEKFISYMITEYDDDLGVERIE